MAHQYPIEPATHPATTAQDQPRTRAQRTRLASLDLMRSGCPTCLLLGLAVLPFEALVRWVARFFARLGP